MSSSNGGSGGTNDQSPGQSPEARNIIAIAMEMDTDTEDEHIMEDSSDEEFMMSSSDEVASPIPSPPPPPPAIMGPIIGYRPDTISASASTTLNTTFWDTLMPSSIFPGVRITRGMPRGANTVSRNLKVFSIAMLPHARPELENGGKIILPPSFLERLTQGVAQLSGPMLFKVTNLTTQQLTHCGVLEFIAEEGKCFMPFWRMHNIGANEGDMITVESLSVPIATYALFEPQSVDFLEISNPKALLENALRNFACITKGEIIVIHYNNRMYELKILDTKPADAVNIIECDMNVDFAPAIGLPQEPDEEEEDSQELLQNPLTVNGYIPFAGAGSRLDGKLVETTEETIRAVPIRGCPDFEWKVGTLQFIRKRFRANNGPQVKQSESFTAFQGTGMTLKSKHSENVQ